MRVKTYMIVDGVSVVALSGKLDVSPSYAHKIAEYGHIPSPYLVLRILKVSFSLVTLEDIYGTVPDEYAEELKRRGQYVIKWA